MPDLQKLYTISGDYSNLVSRIAGYKDTLEYINDCTVTHLMKDVKKPLFFLSAQDDQFFGKDVIPAESNYENILLGVTKTGGHVCYFEGHVLPTSQWFTQPAFEYFNYFEKNKDAKIDSKKKFDMIKERNTKILK